MPVGIVMKSFVAVLSSCRVEAEKVEVWVDPGLKTDKADEVEDKKGGNEFTIFISKGQDKNVVVRFPSHYAIPKVISLLSSEMSS